MKTIVCSCGELILLDDIYPNWFNEYKWTCLYSGAVKSGSRIMSHYIIGVGEGETRDHIDRNIHNNQLSNLRAVTHSQNNLNRGVSKRSLTGFKGVSFRGDRKLNFKASVMIEGVTHHIGCFATQEEAARAYDKFVLEKIGPLAVTNFPKPEAILQSLVLVNN